MVCLFKAKFNETEWEGGGVAPGPTASSGPAASSSLYPLPTCLCSLEIRAENNEWPW